MLKQLGKYEIRRELGRGAMGIVYEGFDPETPRLAAIKTVNKSSLDPLEADERLNRFRREAQVAGRLVHPNIITIYEYGEERDMAFIAMELLTGTVLQEFIENGVIFDMKEAANIMYQLLDALEYSHKNAVIHRDIKPANIFIDKNGKIRIADFGIAKIESSILTAAGYVLGSPSFMSPEQYIGNNIDGRSDLYSAGVLLYQLLTGTLPFVGRNLTDIMQKVMHELPLPPGESRMAYISKEMDDVLLKALTKYPEDRFQTAAEFVQAIRHAVAASMPLVDISVTAAETKVKEQITQRLKVNEGAATKSNLAEFKKRLKKARDLFSNKFK